MNLTALDALLVFLTGHARMTGYDIRQLLQNSPAGLFSDSPGAIYPALARLEVRGLLVSEALEGGRRTRGYKRTPAGKAALIQWLKQPVSRDMIRRNQPELDLRFVIISDMLGAVAAEAFVAECAAGYASELSYLEAYCDGPGQQLPAASLASLGLGVRLVRTRLHWCEEQISKATASKGDRHETRSRSRRSAR